MIADLAPAGVVVVEALTADLQLTPQLLDPSEEAAVATAAPRRRREFEEGRRCARASLRLLGHPSTPVPSGPHGEPQWPPGVVGSITHCEGYTAAVVTWTSVVQGIGIDAEPLLPLPPGVLHAVSTPTERDSFSARYSSSPSIPWDLLLFCAKEAVFKAHFPTHQISLDATDIQLSTTTDDWRLEAIVSRSVNASRPKVSRFLIEFRITDDFIGVMARAAH